MITFDDFSKLDLRVAKIITVEPHPNAEKLYILKVDIGNKVIQLIAGLKPFYCSDELAGRLIVVLINLESKNIRGAISEGMLLAAQGSNDISLIVPDRKLAAGSIIR